MFPSIKSKADVKSNIGACSLGNNKIRILDIEREDPCFRKAEETCLQANSNNKNASGLNIAFNEIFTKKTEGD